MTHSEFRAKYGDVPSKQELTLLCQRLDDPTKRIFVFFPEASKVGVKEIKDILARMKEEAVDRAIMVAGSNLTPFARSVVAEIAGKQTVEVFLEAELLVNITRHVLVPEHRVLSSAEKRVLLDRYKVRWVGWRCWGVCVLRVLRALRGCASRGALSTWRTPLATNKPPLHPPPPTHPTHTHQPQPSTLKVRESQLPRIQLSDPVARYYGLQRGQVVRIVRPSETAGRYVTYRWCV